MTLFTGEDKSDAAAALASAWRSLCIHGDIRGSGRAESVTAGSAVQPPKTHRGAVCSRRLTDLYIAYAASRQCAISIAIKIRISAKADKCDCENAVAMRVAMLLRRAIRVRPTQIPSKAKHHRQARTECED